MVMQADEPLLNSCRLCRAGHGDCLYRYNADQIIATLYIVIIRPDPSRTSCPRRAAHGVLPLVSLDNTEEDVADQS